MLLVCFSFYLKISFEIRISNFGSPSSGRPYIRGQGCEDPWLFVKAERGPRAKVWEMLAWRSVTGLSPQCWGWTKASSGASCSGQSATETGFSRVLRFTSVSAISPTLRTPIHSCMHSFINDAVFVCYQSTASLNSNKIRWKSVVTLKPLHRDRRLDGPQIYSTSGVNKL